LIIATTVNIVPHNIPFGNDIHGAAKVEAPLGNLQDKKVKPHICGDQMVSSKNSYVHSSGNVHINEGPDINAERDIDSKKPQPWCNQKQSYHEPTQLQICRARGLT
jgi:hypothetical protein